MPERIRENRFRVRIPPVGFLFFVFFSIGKYDIMSDSDRSR